MWSTGDKIILLGWVTGGTGGRKEVGVFVGEGGRPSVGLGILFAGVRRDELTSEGEGGEGGKLTVTKDKIDKKFS